MGTAAMRTALTCLLAAAHLSGCASAPAETATPGRRGEQMVRAGNGAYEMSLVLNRADAVFTDTIALDPLRAWAELPHVFGALGLPINAANAGTKELGVVAHTPRRIEGQRVSTFLDCGTGPTGTMYADSYQVHLWVASRILEGAGAGASRVQTIVRANARPRDTSGEPLACTSRGRLERRVLELLRQRAAGGDG
jgi:hypothetical protein